MNDNLLGAETTPPSIDPNKNYRDELVGEGRKFKTDEELARGKYEADNYIKTLEVQLDAIREDFLAAKEEATAKAKLQDLIDKLEGTRQQSASNAQTQANAETQRPSYDPREIESLVSNKVLEIEDSRKKQQNFELVRNKLKERYGDNHQTAVKHQIDVLGISEARLNEMARSEPQVLIKALGLDTPVQTDNYQAPPRSSQRSDSFAPTTNQKRTWSFYQKMRKENPALYNSRQTNINMHNDAIELGAAFQDGDFNAYN